MGKDAVEKINEIWNAAEKQAEEAWCEMDEFLKWLKQKARPKRRNKWNVAESNS